MGELVQDSAAADVPGRNGRAAAQAGRRDLAVEGRTEAAHHFGHQHWSGIADAEEIRTH